jgi:hypothetical protein
VIMDGLFYLLLYDFYYPDLGISFYGTQHIGTSLTLIAFKHVDRLQPPS